MIISTYTKMTRGDSVREGLCPYPRCTAYGNFAILLSLMQRVTGYLLTPKDFDF